jgi:hypothetical protein
MPKKISNLRPYFKKLFQSEANMAKKKIPTSGQYVYAKLIFFGDKLSWRDI